MCKCKSTSRLGVIPLGVALGVVSGLWLMFTAWASYNWGIGTTLITQWGQIYQGYAATVQGGLLGFLWGFIDGFVTGIVLAWIYNLVLCCCRASCGCRCGITTTSYEGLNEGSEEIRIKKKRLL